MVPFAPKIVQLVEARIRVEDINAAARRGDDHRDDEGAGAADGGTAARQPGAGALGATAVDQMRAITASGSTSTTATTRSSRGGWACRTRKLDEALKAYAALLREKVAAENLPAPATAASATPVEAAAQLKFADVPDLGAIVALPQDEMRDIVARFTGPAAAAAAAGAAASAPRDGRIIPSG